jgi:hypothetical protein
MDPFAATLLAALALAALQAVPGFLPEVDGPRRQAVLSAAAGFSTAFVFLELLPQVLERAEAVGDRTGGVLGFVTHEVLLLALVGLLAFYGLETLARATRGRVAESTDDPVGLVQVSAFAAYYGLIGYLLWVQADDLVGSLVPFAVAVGVHFLVVDYGLRAHHPVAYRRVGRFALAAMVLVGWAVGALAEVPPAFVGIGIAFLAGAVMLITFKEELPDRGDTRFGAFAGGAAAYTALLAVL